MRRLDKCLGRALKAGCIGAPIRCRGGAAAGGAPKMLVVAAAAAPAAAAGAAGGGASRMLGWGGDGGAGSRAPEMASRRQMEGWLGVCCWH